MARKKRKLTAEERLEREAARQRSAQFLEVLERAEAALPPAQRRPAGVSNSEWLLVLAKRGQAELDRRKQPET